MSEAPTLIESLASLIVQSTLSSLTEESLHQAKLCTLDTIACMVSGMQLPGVEAMLNAELAEPHREEASVVGRSVRLSAEGAARVNGYMGDILELNDNTGGHASIAVICGVAALAERLGASGADALRAMAVGIEVVCRVHAGYYSQIKPYTEAGLSPTAIPNAVGCAAAAAMLLGLDETRTSHALAIGAALSSWCPAEAFFGQGGSVKPVLFGGWPAANGIRSARLAAQGLSGPLAVLESPIGYYATVARGFDPAPIIGIGPWLIERPRRKRHACCGYMHSALDTLAAIRAETRDVFMRPQPPEIEIRIPPQYIDAVSKGGRPPVDDAQARFNFEYCAALVACGAPVIQPVHSLEHRCHVARPEVAAQLARIRIIGDPRIAHYEYCRITVSDVSSSASICRDGGPALGAPSNPMMERDVIAKVDTLVRPHYPDFDFSGWVHSVMTLDQAPDTRWLIGGFGPTGVSVELGK
jgi:2-methylcitrate dehydratase PrpD